MPKHEEKVRQAWEFLSAIRMPMQIKHVNRCHFILSGQEGEPYFMRSPNGKNRSNMQAKEALDDILLETEFAIDGALHWESPIEEKMKIAETSKKRFDDLRLFVSMNQAVSDLLFRWNLKQMGIQTK